jgi:DDE superfamily endonuclease
VVTVTGGHDTRVSLAALIAVRPGCRPRLIYRARRGRRGDKRKGFTEMEYARLLDAAHQQLGGPVVLVWDGLNTHTSRAMRELIAVRSWLTVCRLPPYAPELNPVEPVWSNLKSHMCPGGGVARARKSGMVRRGAGLGLLPPGGASGGFRCCQVRGRLGRAARS